VGLELEQGTLLLKGCVQQDLSGLKDGGHPTVPFRACRNASYAGRASYSGSMTLNAWLRYIGWARRCLRGHEQRLERHIVGGYRRQVVTDTELDDDARTRRCGKPP
jgi:hypothetical protein